MTITHELDRAEAPACTRCAHCPRRTEAEAFRAGQRSALKLAREKGLAFAERMAALARRVVDMFPESVAERDEWVEDQRTRPGDWRYALGPHVYFHRDGQRALAAEHVDQTRATQ